MNCLTVFNTRSPFKLSRIRQGYFLLFVGSILSMVSSYTLAANNWQPRVSDKLIQLPANIIYERLESDFSASPLAEQLNTLEHSLTNHAQQIKALQTLKLQANDQERLALNIDIVDKKSVYVRLLKQSHELRSQALNQRQAVYEHVLAKLNHQQSNQPIGQSYQIQKAKLAAKSRLDNSHEKVQQLLTQKIAQSANEGVPKYQLDYQQNINKIAQLKQAFNTHVMNANPKIDGVTVTDKEYVRELLIRLSTERSILSQENTMLNYMTKIVALDAQNLTTQLTNTISDGTSSTLGGNASKSNYRLASEATDLFIGGDNHE